jgi:hypothetical protein
VLELQNAMGNFWKCFVRPGRAAPIVHPQILDLQITSSITGIRNRHCFTPNHHFDEKYHSLAEGADVARERNLDT